MNFIAMLMAAIMPLSVAVESTETLDRSILTSSTALEGRVSVFTSAQRVFNATSASDGGMADRRSALAANFTRLFPSEDLPKLVAQAPAETTREFFYRTFDYLLLVSALDNAYESQLPILERIFAAMEEHGVADDQIYQSMHHFHLTFRQFDKAEALRAARPDLNLAPPPELIAEPTDASLDGDHRALLALVDGALRQEALDMSAPGFVIVVGHPRCGFSKAAAAAIRDDPELSRLMVAYARWIADPYASLTDGAIAGWNASHPAQSIRYAYARSDWPEMNYWGTPSFYFFRNGELVAKVVGWPWDDADNRKAALMEGFKAIGVSP